MVETSRTFCALLKRQSLLNDSRKCWRIVSRVKTHQILILKWCKWRLEGESLAWAQKQRKATSIPRKYRGNGKELRDFFYVELTGLWWLNELVRKLGEFNNGRISFGALCKDTRQCQLWQTGRQSDERTCLLGQVPLNSGPGTTSSHLCVLGHSDYLSWSSTSLSI